jgi:hypothetical protein
MVQAEGPTRWFGICHSRSATTTTTSEPHAHAPDQDAHARRIQRIQQPAPTARQDAAAPRHDLVPHGKGQEGAERDDLREEADDENGARGSNDVRVGGGKDGAARALDEEGGDVEGKKENGHWRGRSVRLQTWILRTSPRSKKAVFLTDGRDQLPVDDVLAGCHGDGGEDEEELRDYIQPAGAA